MDFYGLFLEKSLGIFWEFSENFWGGIFSESFENFFRRIFREVFFWEDFLGGIFCLYC